MTQGGFMLTTDFINNCLTNPLQNERCHQLHDGDCNIKALKQFGNGCKGLYKMYLLVHIIPLLLKRKQLLHQPISHLLKTVFGFVKSMLFAGGYSAVVRRLICLLTQHVSYNTGVAFVSGVFGGVTLLFEPRGRQMQIAMYTLNKSMEVTYNMALRRNYPVRMKYGECVLNGVALAILCFVYVLDANAYRPNYRKLIDKVLKDV